MKSFQFTIDGRKYDTTVNEIDGGMAEVTVNGTVFHVGIDQMKNATSIKPAAPRAAAAPAAAPKVAQAAGTTIVKSPLPGSIVKVVAAAGQAVKRGDLLLTMESMKMENQVLSEVEGTVKAVLVQPGQNVMQDDKLVEIETVAIAAAPAAAPAAPKAAPAPKPAAAPAPAAPAPAAPKAADVPAGGKKVVSPLPGSIIKVVVTEGQAVKKGDLLLTLESMKMENSVLAECDGTVTKIAVTAGQNVMQDDLLVVLG